MRIREFLSSRRVPFQVLLHSPTPCASRLAQSLHVPGARVAKGVLLKDESTSGFLLAVLPSTHRIDLARLGAILQAASLRLATESELESIFTDCELGALPPFGTLYGLRTVIDASLAAGSEIIVEGNLRHEGMKLLFRDYEALERPTRARFATAADPGRRPPTQRRAG